MEALLSQYIEYLNEKTRKEPELIGIESSHSDLDMLYLVVYDDFPVKGTNTAFTYGLSAAAHTEWVNEKPELSMVLNNGNREYFQSMGYLTEWQRADHAFKSGSLFRFGRPIASHTFMDSFLVFDQVSEVMQDMASVSFAQLNIRINGLYPLYHDEIPMIKQVGIKKFFGLKEFHPYDASRPDLSKIYAVKTEEGQVS